VPSQAADYYTGGEEARSLIGGNHHELQHGLL